MLSYLLYKFGEFLSLCLPWKAAYQLGVFLAKLQFKLSKKDREAVMGNLRVILPNEPEAIIIKKAEEVFVNFGLYLVEFFRFSEIDLNYVDKHFIFDDKNVLDEAIKNKRGAILLTAHMSNWELGGMALALKGYPMMAIALDHKNPKVNNFFIKRRRSKGMEVISLGLSVKKCFSGLRDKKFLAILGDRDFSNSSYEMPFLGKTKKIPRGPAVLSMHTDSLIIPVFMERRGINNFILHISPAINTDKNMTEKQIIEKYVKLIEEQIYKNPSQWLMFREFWKE